MVRVTSPPASPTRKPRQLAKASIAASCVLLGVHSCLVMTLIPLSQQALCLPCGVNYGLTLIIVKLLFQLNG